MWTEAYVNGEKTEVMTKGAHNEAGAGGVITAAGVYKAEKTNDKDQITSVASVIAKTAITGVQAEVASGNTLKLNGNNLVSAAGTGKDWSYDSETVFVSIDKDGDVTADTNVPSGIEEDSGAAVGDSIFYVAVTERKGGEGKDLTTAKVVYVVEAIKPKTAVNSVTITGVAAPVKDATLGTPAVTEDTVAMVSYQWHDDTNNADKNAGATIAGSTTYKLTITLKIADSKTATHDFGTMSSVKIGSKTGVWDGTAKTLTFTFDATGA